VQGKTSAAAKDAGAALTRLRVVVGEESFLMREGIVHALADTPSIDVVAAEADLDALRAAIDRLSPDVVVTGIRMPPTKTDEGIRLAKELHSTHPKVAVVVLSQQAIPSYATALFADGASQRAYLLKDRIADPAHLIEAVKSVAQGRPMLDAKIVELLLGLADRHRPGLEDLTPRELEVLALVGAGRSNDAIAHELVVTRRAVERHINAIFAKLGLNESPGLNRRVLAALLYARSALGS
jgi:DNA-binding NarL/FixJ family response regulator